MLIKRAHNALQRLQAYTTGSSIWDGLPYTRRAAVLVILYKNWSGELGSVLTMRSNHLSSFAGHAALPGGKADHSEESAIQIARRETCEEIGLSADNELLKQQGYTLEHTCTLPAYLSRNLLAVRPVVAYLKNINPDHGIYHNSVIDLPAIISTNHSHSEEVSEVFSVPLSKFLSGDSEWHNGKHVNWSGLSWNQHWFKATRRQKQIGDLPYMWVWGLTADIMVDVARIAYGVEPEMPHRKPGSFGDETLISALLEHGCLPAKVDKKADLSIHFAEVFGSDSPLLDTRR